MIALSLPAAAATAQLGTPCSQWAACGSGTNNSVLAVVGMPDDTLVAGGYFSSAGGSPASRVAQFDGNSWQALGGGMDNAVRSLAVLPNGDLIAAGDFSTAGGAPASRIARWDGLSWSPLGSGVSSASAFGLYAVAATAAGDVYTGGYFQTAGGVPAAAIARWNGSAWSPLGSGCPGTVFAILPLANGDILVGGNFSTAGGVFVNRVARWNGSSWSALGSGVTGFRVNALAELPNGDLVVGGAFTAAGGVPASNLARWNGSSWSALAGGADGDVLALEVMPNGDLLVGGQFSHVGGLAARGLARLHGSSWEALGFSGGADVYSLSHQPDSTRVVGGAFFSAGGTPAAFVARYETACPPDAYDSGAGCPGSGGANLLESLSLPWGGAAWQLRGSGLPSLCIALTVTGFDVASVPLAAVLPPSPSGCQLLCTPDLIGAAVPVGGALDLAIGLPDNVLLYGVELHQQLVLLELAPGSLGVVETTASNRVSGVLGFF